MRQAFLSISALLSGVGIMTLGYGLLGTLLAVRMSVEGFPTFVSGLVMSAFFFGLMVGSLTVQRLIETVGHIRTFSALASVFSAATLVHVFVIEPWTWGALRFAEGYAMAGLFMCVESWLNDRATNETRGAVLSMYMITTYLFGALGQFLLATAAVEGFFLFALTSALLSVALVPIALTRAEQPSLPVRTTFGIRKLLAISPLGVAGCFAAGCASGAFYGLAPRYAATVGLDQLGISFLMGFAIFGGLILQWPVGRLSDRLDRRKLIAVVSLLLTAAGAGIALWTAAGPDGQPASAGGVEWALLALIVAFGGMMFSIYPLSLSHANDFIDRGDFVAASGALILFYSIGATLGPIAASASMELVGAWGLFAFIGAVAFILAGFAWYRTRAPAVAAEEKTRFQITPRTTYVLSELDPRAEDDQLSFDFDFPTEEARTPSDERKQAA